MWNLRKSVSFVLVYSTRCDDNRWRQQQRHRDLKLSWMSILTFPYDWKIYYATERETPQRVKSKQHFYGGSAEINDHYLFHLDVWCFRENVSHLSYGVAAVLNPFRVSPKSLRFPLFSPPSMIHDEALRGLRLNALADLNNSPSRFSFYRQ